MISRKLFKCVHGDGIMLADYRYHPMHIYRWFGSVDERLVDHIYGLRDAHGLESGSNHSQVWIHDITDMGPVPATVRRHLADKQTADPRQDDFDNFIIIPIVSNPLFRGVMTAVSWMAGKGRFPMEFSPDLKGGVQKARLLFEKWNISVREVPSPYKFPTESEAEFTPFSMD